MVTLKRILYITFVPLILLRALPVTSQSEAENLSQQLPSAGSPGVSFLPAFSASVIMPHDQDLRRLNASILLPFRERIVFDFSYGYRNMEGRSLNSISYGAVMNGSHTDSSKYIFVGGFRKESINHPDLSLRDISLFLGLKTVWTQLTLTSVLQLDYILGTVRADDDTEYAADLWPVSLGLSLDRKEWFLSVKLNGTSVAYKLGWNLWL